MRVLVDWDCIQPLSSRDAKAPRRVKPQAKWRSTGQGDGNGIICKANNYSKIRVCCLVLAAVIRDWLPVEKRAGCDPMSDSMGDS